MREIVQSHAEHARLWRNGSEKTRLGQRLNTRIELQRVRSLLPKSRCPIIEVRSNTLESVRHGIDCGPATTAFSMHDVSELHPDPLSLPTRGRGATTTVLPPRPPPAVCP
jgi:hypothetical protein